MSSDAEVLRSPSVERHSPLAAAITAGGRSRRFGQDKARYALGGISLLDRVAGSLEHHAPRLLIAPEGRYDLPGWRNVPDLRPGEGPLAGLETALSVLEASAVSNGWLAFSAVDLPNLVPGYWRLLKSRISPTAQVVAGHDAHGRPQLLAALYHVSIRPRVTALLGAGERRMRALLDEVETETVPWHDLESEFPDVYVNLNVPPAG